MKQSIAESITDFIYSDEVLSFEAIEFLIEQFPQCASDPEKWAQDNEKFLDKQFSKQIQAIFDERYKQLDHDIEHERADEYVDYLKDLKVGTK